ncbi:SPOR domain-containing protein [Sediminicoccus sp. KRV36]|uniref:septal ring lytic transglycosylase RlpA family protein n=1 Tax=Sediminicoccus sp. KRV36 TaxID=3133721 RepID=UPI00200F8ACA|nr:SPOR domain-containing protein [Sediminicoccus rosea]UPY35024.1 SPOR domain-containing protein [Sediminicoccus rosea]
MPTPQPRYHLGEPYRAGGLWSYPKEEFALDEAGIAAIMPQGQGLTANGEARDGQAMVAAHRTLQLPAIVTVTNLDNGRSLRLRVHDRGPAMAGRVIAVSPRAATLLGASGPFRARVVLDGNASRQTIEGLAGQAAPLPIATAPVGRVERESLAPPDGARAAAQRAESAARPLTEPSVTAREPERLPEQVIQGAPNPGRIWLEAGRFFRRDLAQAQAARIGGRAEPFGPAGRQQQWRVRAGPYSSISEADAALARAITLGQPDLRLAVE